MSHEEIYIITDGCMWEQNKRNSTYHPHAIEVVNLRTGQVQYIKSGSQIIFKKGEITDIRTQEIYNKATEKVSSNAKNKLQRADSKKGSRKIHRPANKNESL